jgi:hypothetical protein
VHWIAERLAIRRQHIFIVAGKTGRHRHSHQYITARNEIRAIGDRLDGQRGVRLCQCAMRTRRDRRQHAHGHCGTAVAYQNMIHPMRKSVLLSFALRPKPS